MKLITEEITDVEFITEEKNGKKSMYIEGIFLQADIQNRNGRCYPYETLLNEVNRYVEQKVDRNMALGELCHPTNSPAINLDRVSHMIVSLKPKGNNFIGKAKILEHTPMGKIAAALINEGVRLGVSSRGVGSLAERNGVRYVSDDFMLITAADIVSDPSAPEAFVNGIYECVEWIYDSKRKTWIAESIKNIMERDVRSRKLTEERKLEHFQKFLDMI